MKNGFSVSTILSAAPEKIFRAWLSTDGHTAMTGSPAKVEPHVGGTFSAWDGYIFGTTLEAKPYTRIVQAWRTTEFPEGSADSRVEILLEAVEGGTKITLVHSAIPEGQTDGYKQGWEDFYFKPMKEYFTK
ncbi:MAG: SRPBCC domain-containing protein [Chloroflexi bacterium]|nr:SRPBCC domain-containing protein [Chloroflexota bacterium]